MKFSIPPFWAAVGLISGLIIGSGIFALPYAASLSGVNWTIVFAFLAFFAALAIHLAYAEIVAHTPGRHRMPGYLRMYFGKFFGKLEAFNQILIIHTVLLGYAVLGGIFLGTLFGGSAVFWTGIFFALGALVLLGPAREIGFIDFLLVIPLVVALLWISALGLKYGLAANLHIAARDPFFVFGVFLFAVNGYIVIPDAYAMFKRSASTDHRFRLAVITGTFIPFIITGIFVIAVLMVSGSGVTEDALSGLRSALGENVVRVGALIGLLAVATSYLALGYELKEVYEIDFQLGKIISWALGASVPAVLFYLGVDDFVRLIALAGGFFIALDGIFIILILRKIRRSGRSFVHFLPLGSPLQFILIVLFALSAIYEIVYQFNL